MKWKPGESGNPNGRPKKGETLTDALRELTDKEELAQKLLELAREGNLNALRYIYDRIDGRPVETVRQHVSGAPQVIEVIHGEDPTDTEDIEALEE